MSKYFCIDHGKNDTEFTVTDFKPAVSPFDFNDLALVTRNLQINNAIHLINGFYVNTILLTCRVTIHIKFYR